MDGYEAAADALFLFGPRPSSLTATRLPPAPPLPVVVVVVVVVVVLAVPSPVLLISVPLAVAVVESAATSVVEVELIGGGMLGGGGIYTGCTVEECVLEYADSGALAIPGGGNIVNLSC